MSRLFSVLLCGAAITLASGGATAHPLRPALLHLEPAPGATPLYEVTFKLPGIGDQVAPVSVQLPERCQAVNRPVASPVRDGVVQRWRVDCGAEGLDSARIDFIDLSRKVGEILVIYVDAQGGSRSFVARADHPSVTLGDEAAQARALWHYLPLGVEHILLGIDHLLFVLGLMLLIFWYGVGRMEVVRLLWTITAFTVAHSLTLAAASLGLVHVPSDAVELVIAMSILLLAVEVARPEEAEITWTARRPALVAFAFGLLHGFGFAGALAELGLPEDGIAGALLLFNVGVELGQLAFVVAIGLLWWLLRRMPDTVVSTTRWAAVHALGALAVYWSLDRGSALVERLLNS